MSNPLTGDFDAVLQVSGSTINRLLATMHGNEDTKPDLPSFPHTVWIRVGDPTPIDGMRGNIHGQVSVPRIELVHGVTDHFWLEVAIRARYIPDAGTVHIPEFIHGTVRAQYRIEKIDAGCRGWEKLASDYVWVRAVGDTVSFTGTATDDTSQLMAAALAVTPAEADARITRLARFLLTKGFEATPHKVSRRFRSGSMRSLNPGPNQSAVAIPVGLSGDPPSGSITSINQEFLDGRHVGIAISKDFIIGKIQAELDAVRESFSTSLRFYHKTHVDLGFLGGFDALTVTIDYTIKLVSATAQWLGGSVLLGGVTLPGGFITLQLNGQARTPNPLFNFDFNVTQMLMISFNAAKEEFMVAPVGSPAVGWGLIFSAVVAPHAEPTIQSEVATAIKNAVNGMAGQLSFANRKSELVTQLQTMDDLANVVFDSAAFTSDGVIVRGAIIVSGERKPVHAFAVASDKNGYSASNSWIPGGRVDSFSWSWKWSNNTNKPGKSTFDDRFLLERPAAKGNGKFGLKLGLQSPLPGLDGMGQMCLTVRGQQVHRVTGEMVPVAAVKRCKQFGLDVRVAVPDRLFLREWVPGPRDPIGPVAESAIHEVGGDRISGHGANTLVVRVGERWNTDVAAALRDGLAGSTRRDAGLVVLILFSDGLLLRDSGDRMSEFRQLTEELEAQLVVNEDVRGTWARALSMDSSDGESGEIEWRLISPTGGVTWGHRGAIDAQGLASALDDYLFRSPSANSTRSTYQLPLGTRVSSFAFESDVMRRLSEMEDACPPPPFGRLGVATEVSFVAAGAASSQRSLEALAAKGEGSEGVRAVVFDGATPEEVSRLRDSLPAGVMPIADPDGTIARRFGVRVWPSSLSIDGRGFVSAFESESDRVVESPEESEAS